ncbi:MAG: hypothetical protein H6737_29205 [Alphaproteobacteria bacterium]|nr:hypothetical protein [Alphaproteobacteria bacterium]
MAVLATTLASALRSADGHFRAGRPMLARHAYEELLEKAQARTDRSIEVVCRAMLARVAVQMHDLDAAEAHLDGAERLVDPGHAEGQRRVRTARVHWEVAAMPDATGSVRDFLAWAETEREPEALLEGARLMASAVEGIERAQWLERAIEVALEHRLDEADLLDAWFQLAATRDTLDDLEGALEAYRSALALAVQPRGTVMAGWGVGSLLLRLEDWPQAREQLEETVRLAEEADDCEDLLCFALAELATVTAEAGDVVEARHLLVRSLEVARAQDLATLWPAKWEELLEQADGLDL